MEGAGFRGGVDLLCKLVELGGTQNRPGYRSDLDSHLLCALAVRRMLGHTSAAMTLDVYSDLFDSDLDSVSEALDTAAGRAGVASLFTDSDATSIN